jgi:hypothetical protein
MPSTYSPSLKIELIGNGEQSGTWGQTTNNNLGTLIEQAIAGVGQITLVGDTVLTNYNGLPDESRNAVLVFSGVLASPANVVAPSVEKTYIVTNNSGANVTIKTASGNGVTIQNGLNSLVYCDGINFYTAVNVNNVIGDLSVSGNETVGGTLTIGTGLSASNLAVTANSGIVTMAANTGAFLPPTGTTAQRPGTPAVGMSRWNTDLGAYEIWTGVSWQIIASGSYSLAYIVAAGGGGGGGVLSNGGGGGGAGGVYTSSSYAVTPSTTYSFVVGGGGSVNTNGSNSTAFGLTAVGGGGGTSTNGQSGGCGAGSGANSGYSAGSGTVGQGYGGGVGTSVGASGGGGGAGAVGGAGTGNQGGAGGTGILFSPTSSYYGGGGGGGSYYTSNGGAGGGGKGGGAGTAGNDNGSPGTANTGGGGGGAGTANGGGATGAAGGSGVVVLAIPTISYTGITTGSPTVTISGSNTILTYTSSGTYTA